MVVTAPDARLSLIGSTCFTYSGAARSIFTVAEEIAIHWDALSTGMAIDKLTQALATAGLEAERVTAQIIEAGLVRVIATDKRPVKVAAYQHLRLGNSVILACFENEAFHSACMDGFSHLSCAPASCNEVVYVAECENGAGIGVAGNPPTRVGFEELVPAFKAHVTEACLTSRPVPAFHAAMVTRDSEGILIFGEPGEGKSTLALALSSCGYLLAGDDIVFFQADAQATALPLPAAVKQGSWPLLTPLLPELAKHQEHLRYDGQRVKFLPRSASGVPLSVPVALLLVLDRRASGRAMAVELPAAETLTHVLAGAWSKTEELSADDFTHLATCLSNAACFRLSYASLDDAMDLVNELWHRLGHVPASELYV